MSARGVPGLDLEQGTGREGGSQMAEVTSVLHTPSTVRGTDKGPFVSVIGACWAPASGTATARKMGEVVSSLCDFITKMLFICLIAARRNLLLYFYIVMYTLPTSGREGVG